MTICIELFTQVPCSAEELFTVSLDLDAHMASMEASGEQAIAGVTGGQIGFGQTVTWRARHLGIWFTLQIQITAYNKPHSFVDEQVKGPFGSFHHEHVFVQRAGYTQMIDVLTLSSPIGGPIGFAAEHLFLKPYLRRLILQRNRHLQAGVQGGN